MALRAKETVDNTGIILFGSGIFKDDLTLAQDGARAAALAPFTVLAQQASDLKLVPLTDVDQAMTPANMVCGAIGGTGAEFAAVTDAELRLTVDGEVITLADMDMSGLDSATDTPGYMTAGAIGGTMAEFAAVADAQFGIAIDGNAAIQVGPIDMSGLDSVADTPGYMTCGAIGATLPELAAVADGQFGIAFDGLAPVQIAGMDFTGIDTVEDTPGYWTCGANGDVIGNWDALTDASFSYVADGVAYDTGQMNLTLSVTFDGLVNIINWHLDGHATITYSYTDDIFKLTSNKTGETSAITIGAPAGGTDISAAAWLNAAAGAATAGTGGENLGETPASIINAALVGQGLCYFNGDAFVFVSRTAGEVSQVDDLTAGTAGTDISGAAFLNGLAGVNVQGTGGEGTGQTIATLINAAAQGRFSCYYDGDAFVFVSPTAGEVSAVADLTAGTAGTDISGAAFLNGLAGVNVAGTGGEGLYESISEIINAHAAGRFTVDFNGDAFVFYSPTSGPVKSQITVLSDPASGGTYIGGAAYLNGETGTGTVTAATGNDGTDTPSGIYWGSSILAATLVSGDVTNRKVLVGGDMYTLDEAKVVLENSLDLDDVIVSSGKTIRQHLELMGIFTRDVSVNGQVAPI